MTKKNKKINNRVSVICMTRTVLNYRLDDDDKMSIDTAFDVPNRMTSHC